MRALAWGALVLLAGCGGAVSEGPCSGGSAGAGVAVVGIPAAPAGFVAAVCSHATCAGWPEQQVCEYSYEAALARLGPQNEACLSNATALLEQPGCGPLIQTVADDVVNGKCTSVR